MKRRSSSNKRPSRSLSSDILANNPNYERVQGSGGLYKKKGGATADFVRVTKDGVEGFGSSNKKTKASHLSFMARNTPRNER